MEGGRGRGIFVVWGWKEQKFVQTKRSNAKDKISMTRPDVNQFGTASRKAETKSTRRQVPAGDETTSDTLTSVFKRKFGFPLVFPSRWLIWQTTSWCEVLLKLSEVFLFNCFIRRLFFMICQFVADNSNLLIDCEFCRFQFSADFS